MSNCPPFMSQLGIEVYVIPLTRFIIGSAILDFELNEEFYL